MFFQSEEIEINKDGSHFEIWINGHRRMLFDKLDNKVFRCEPEFFNFKNVKYELCSLSELSEMCYIEDGFYHASSGRHTRKIVRSGILVSDSRGRYFGCDCSYETYKQLIPYILEFDDEIPIGEYMYNELSVQLGHSRGMENLYRVIFIVLIFFLATPYLFGP
jgi:hypothetical protein